MLNQFNLNWSDIHTLVFDFDGIFTNNKVYTSENGTEIIKCDKSDSLGLDILRRYIILKNWDLDYFILTKEANPVVGKRAEKLKIKCFQAEDNKLDFLKNRLSNRFNELNNCRKGLVYLGNDLNDYSAIKFSGYSFAPNDANRLIKENCDFVLKKNGGCGCVREFIDELLNLNQLDGKLLSELI